MTLRELEGDLVAPEESEDQRGSRHGGRLHRVDEVVQGQQPVLDHRHTKKQPRQCDLDCDTHRNLHETDLASPFAEEPSDAQQHENAKKTLHRYLPVTASNIAGLSAGC